MPAMQGKTVFVTGAGGFIGPAVVDVLVAAQANVRALLGAPDHKVREPAGAATTVRADITDTATLYDSMAGADVVVHLAGPASVAASFESAVEYAHIHVQGTVAVLDVCRRLQIRRFIYVSSAEVYGHPQTNPVREDHPLQAQSPYAAAKVGAEHFIQAFVHAFGITAVILRPFSIYGPGLSPHSLIGTILQQARHTDTVTLADLRPVRDYCYVQDLAAAIVQACVTEIPACSVLNIGTGIGTSVRELAQLILRLLGRDLPVREAPHKKRPGRSEIYRLIADPQQARQVLGWFPKFSLQSGLAHMIQGMA